MLAILKRELSSYFTSPIGYVFLAVFYFFSGMFFYSVLYSNSTDISYVFSGMFTVLLFVVPLLTMRLMSEEKKQKTDQLLLTSPVSLTGLVLGKFLAAVCMYAIALAVTVVYSLILAGFASPEWMVVIGNIFGSLLLGAALIAIGLFISSMTENQMIAAVGSFAVMMFILMMDSFVSIIPSSLSFISKILTGLSFMTRYNELVTGILNIGTILFFISVAVVFNFLTVRVLEKRRWGR
ncbi:MAG: ABC transporter permease subunit [Oscillospiraceae bacterium]|jgi:ABC-2 type transport system permease protein|nr:ABC transporter permease subunit [Oscillospiraceae bacterium]